jgi:flagellar biosynthetic protein FliQ
VLFGSAMLGLVGDFTKEIFDQIAMTGKG